MGSTLKGFVAGSLALIILYVVVQPGTSGKVEQGGNTLVALTKRLFSPEVAGIGDHSKTSDTGGSREGGRAPNPTTQPQGEFQPQGSLFT
jgi:hypothetical protein